MLHVADQNTGNLLEAFRTQSAQKQISEPKALSSGQMKPKKSKRRKVRNGMIKLYVNGVLLLIASALVFVAYRLAVIPQLFPPEAEAGPKTEQTTAKVEVQDYQGAANFGLSFGYYWIKGDLEIAKNYTANNYVFPEKVLTPVPKEVLWSKIWDVTPVSKDKVNVVVQASVKSSGGEGQDNTPKVVYLSVPLVMENGKYGVYDIPTFVPTPGKATFKEEEAVSAPIQQADQDNIKARVNVFLDEYFGGKPEKLAIYFKDNKPRATLADAELTGIHEIKINQVAEDNTKQVVVNVTADTVVNGVVMLQKFQVNMVKNGQEWDIEKTNPHLPISKVVKTQ